LISDDLGVRIMDFGLSRVIGKSVMTAQIGSDGYMAPEMKKADGRYDNKVDVYSFGAIIFRAIFHAAIQEILQNPLKRKEYHKILKEKMLPDIMLDFWKLHAKSVFGRSKQEFVWIKELMLDCVAFDAIDRPDFGAILEIFENRFGGQLAQMDALMVKPKERVQEPMVIYMKREEEEDEDAIDMLLKDVSFAGLTELVRKDFLETTDDVSFTIKLADGEDVGKEIAEDMDVQKLNEDCMLSIAMNDVDESTEE